MTSKEYLRQAYLLDAQINSQIRELESLKSMRGDRFNTNREYTY